MMRSNEVPRISNSGQRQKLAIVSPSNLIAQREEGESAPCVFVIKRRRGGETIKEARHKKKESWEQRERSDLKILL